jgi:hypothetical protein
MRQSLRVSSCVALCNMTPYATAIDFEVDPAQSSINVSIEIDVGIASDTDNDSSPLSGMLNIDLDDYGNPSTITLSDLLISIDNNLNFNWSFSFFGGANASLTGGLVTWGSTDNVVGPVPIVDNSFSLPDVPIALQGMMNYNYDILLVGTGSDIVDLSTLGDSASTIDGNVSIDGDLVTVTSSLPLDTTTPLTDANGTVLGTLTITGTANIVATATAPSCPVDLTGDGVLNFFDVSAFLNAYSAMDPTADFDGNGIFNFFDVSAFLNAFTAGCP